MNIRTIYVYIGKIIKCFIPYGIIAYYRFLKRKREKERKISRGNLHSDKTFYVIRRPSPGAGLFSNYHYVLGHLIYALERNYIPIVDMENYKTFFSEKRPINGTQNAWEYFFNQPYPYPLAEVYKSKNVILSRCCYLGPTFPESEKQITYLHDLMIKYLPINIQTKQIVEESKKNLFGEKKNILGIKYRGSDYAKLEYTGHAIVGSIDEYIRKAEKCLSEWELDWIYLSTEETHVVDMFKDKFGSKIIVTESLRIKNYQTHMGESSTVNFGRTNDNYLKGIEYIVDTILLSYCDAIIGPKVNGTMYAIEINNNKYKYKYIYDLGTNS